MSSVGSVHPRTARLSDPDVPALAALLSTNQPAPLAAAVEMADGRLGTSQVTQVTWWPGSSVTVRFAATVEGGALDGPQDFVAVSGRIPSGALVVESDDCAVGVWRVPHDPALPGLAAALDSGRAGELLAGLGVSGGPVGTHLRAYRPGRRAVVSLSGRSHGLFLKLVRPRKVADLQRFHVQLASALPVPKSVGWSPELGVVALQALPGWTLRAILDDPAQPLPEPEQLTALLTCVPAPDDDRSIASPLERLPDTARVLVHILPEHADRIHRLMEALGPDEITERVPVHGDFYEAQVMVEQGHVIGLLDIDTYGWGRPGDDPATMLAHLTLWRHLTHLPERVEEFASRALRHWDRRYDRSDLRRRAAAALLTLAPGAFRVQMADWPSETLRRIEMAERWLESSRQVGERGLISV